MGGKVGVGFGVMLLKGGKVLLGLRNTDPRKADSELHGEGTWTMPGGKIHFGESFEEACYREVFEETGIKISKANLKLVSIANDKVRDAHFITIGFLCTKFTGVIKIMEPDEITNWRWFGLERLPRRVFFCSRGFLITTPRKKYIHSVLDR
ncbi:MAG: NUDIX domain-containing protein [Candidatus Berkelbacteria bacterium]|nr:NUDIX domain-containing protein [Candidatus Berkelbacteria bacterium]